MLELDAQAQPVALKDWGDYRIDETGKLTPAQVWESHTAPDTGWKPTRADALYPLQSGNAVWISFTVPPAPDAERWYVELPDTTLDSVSLFTQDSAGQWNEQKAGDLIAVGKWPVPHRYPLLPISISAEVQVNYLIRLAHIHSASAPLAFVSEGHFNHSEQRVSLALGIFFGLAGLAALISAVSAVSLRDTAYGFYALSVTMMGLTQARITGLAGLHLWPSWPWLNDISASVFPTLELAATLMFVASAVALPERSQRLYRAVVAIAVLGLIMALLLMVTPAEQRLGLFVSYVFLPQAAAIYTLIWAWRRGDRFAVWLIVGLLPVIAASAYMLLRAAGLVSGHFLAVHGTQIALAIELPVIMVILMLRSQHRRENTRRIHGLDRLDPATGLINGHVFAERLLRMVARSERLGHQSAVMLIDIMNTEPIQRDFGRKAADDLPLRVAERLLSATREIDSAARLSDRRFGMLVEGPCMPQDAATLGPRIVARCLMPYKGLHVDCVAQIRIAYAMVPGQGSDAHALLKRLEDRLASLHPDDKRAVFMLGETMRPMPVVRRSKKPQPVP